MSELSKINGFDILPFNKRQIPRVAQAYMSVFNAAPWNEQWSLSAATTRLREVAGTPNCTGFVAMDAKKSVVGFTLGVFETWDKGRQFYVKELGVRPELQQQGIGNALLETMTSAAFKAGATQMILDTDKGIPAEGIFERRDFAIGNRILMFKKNPDGMHV